MGRVLKGFKRDAFRACISGLGVYEVAQWPLEPGRDAEMERKAMGLAIARWKREIGDARRIFTLRAMPWVQAMLIVRIR